MCWTPLYTNNPKKTTGGKDEPNIALRNGHHNTEPRTQIHILVIGQLKKKR